MSILGRKRWRDVARNKGAFAAVVVTIGLGVGGFVAARDAYLGLQGSFTQVYAETRFADFVATGGDVNAFAAAAPKLPGEPLVTERAQGDVPIQVGDHRLIGRIVTMPDSGQPQVNRLDLRSGSLDGDGIYVEYHLADHFRIRPGDSIDLLADGTWKSVPVTAIVLSPEYLWPARSRQEVASDPEQFGVVFAPRDIAQGIGASLVPQVALYAQERKDSAQMVAAAKQLALTTGSEASTRETQPSAEALAADVDGVGEYALLFPILFLTAAALGTYMLLSRLVRAQRVTIGTMLAGGISAGTLSRHFLGLGVLCGIAGAIVGVALGYPLGNWFAGSYGESLGVPYAFAGLHPEVLAIASGLGIVASALAAWWPARGAARMSPAEAMRASAPSGDGRVSLIERALPPLRSLPARWRMMLRGLGRNRRRTWFTIAGVVLAMALVIVPLGLRDTVHILLERQFSSVQTDDLQIFSAPGQNQRLLGAVRQEPEVAVAEPFGRYDAVITYAGAEHPTLLYGFQHGTVMHGFPDGLPSSGIVLPVALQTSMRVKVGDTVKISIPASGAQVSAPVTAFVDEPMAAVAYADLTQVAAWVAVSDPANGVDVRLASGIDRHATVSRLAALRGVAAVLDKAALSASLAKTFSLYDSLVVLMAVIGAAMAIALLFNTVSAGVAERLVEFGTLQAAGMSSAMLSRLVMAENTLLTGLGVVPGLLAGWLLARYFMSAYQSDQFRLALQLEPYTLPLVAAGALGCAALAQALTLRSIARIDVATIVRDRST